MKTSESDTTRDVRIDFRATVGEREVLRKYCERTKRTQSDVLREYIRSLKNRKD